MSVGSPVTQALPLGLKSGRQVIIETVIRLVFRQSRHQSNYQIKSIRRNQQHQRMEILGPFQIHPTCINRFYKIDRVVSMTHVHRDVHLRLVPCEASGYDNSNTTCDGTSTSWGMGPSSLADHQALQIDANLHV
eukprot:4303385-Amphidinium_carterae.4